MSKSNHRVELPEPNDDTFIEDSVEHVHATKSHSTGHGRAVRDSQNKHTHKTRRKQSPHHKRRVREQSSKVRSVPKFKIRPLCGTKPFSESNTCAWIPGFSPSLTYEISTLLNFIIHSFFGRNFMALSLFIEIPSQQSAYSYLNPRYVYYLYN